MTGQGVGLKKRKASANKVKAKKQRKQQLLRQPWPGAVQQQEASAAPGEAEAPLEPSAEGPQEATSVKQLQQPPAEEEAGKDEQDGPEAQQQDAGEEADAATCAPERSSEQQAVLSEYFARKSPEFLASDAYLEGWSKKDLIEYFYDQYLQQDMSPADALASASLYVENPEAYGLVGGGTREDGAAATPEAAAAPGDTVEAAEAAEDAAEADAEGEEGH